MAHIPDGFLSPPVLAGAAAISAAALIVAARRSGQELRDRRAPFLGAATAFVFAAQMFNFPLGAGSSAHLLGGALMAVVAGPWAAMLALFSVTLVQALLFQDGGIAALGANTLNLAVIGAGLAWIVYRWQLALTGSGHRRQLAAAGVAGFVSVVGIGLAVSFQLALSGMVPLWPALLAVGGAHVLIAIAEAGLTVAILDVVLRSRPELVLGAPAPAPRMRAIVGTSTVAVAVALSAVAWGSALPDGLESAAAALGLQEGAPILDVPLAGYDAPVGGGWMAAGVGLTATAAVVWAFLRMAGRARSAA